MELTRVCPLLVAKRHGNRNYRAISKRFSANVQEVNANMRNIRQVIGVAVVALGLGVAVVGCSSSTTTGKDKMQGDKMGTDKMGGDKMGTDKMGTDKMGGDKMTDDKK
jgi:pentapeptide MXKDX repeat protein